MPARPACVLVLLSAASAQAPAPIPCSPPRLHVAGPLPEAPIVELREDGVAGVAASPGERDPDTPADAPVAEEVVLRADARLPASTLTAALARLAARGCTRAAFEVALPDGARGAFVLALPAGAPAPPELTLRGHRARPGVPPEAAVPLLRRLANGLAVRGAGPFVVALEVPADARTGDVVALLAALADGGAAATVLRTGPAAGAGTLALDVDGPLVTPVPATEVALRRRGLQRGPIGLLEPPPELARPGMDGGAGGRYGGRGAGGKRGGGAYPTAAFANAWEARLLGADGVYAGPDGAPDLEGTWLWTLARLGDGTSLAGGRGIDHVRRTFGWLAARQRDDGGFEDDGPGSVRRHAQATWVLAEGAGLSGHTGALLAAATDAAVRRLIALRRDDGGWPATRGAAADASTTAYAVCALTAARFFGHDVPLAAGDLLAWFDVPERAEPDATAAAAELFARFFAGTDPRGDPRAAALADRVAGADPAADPELAHWGSAAMFQLGGKPWVNWSKRLNALREAIEPSGDWRGAWPEVPGHTRVQTAARHTLALTSYYRYMRMVR